MDQIVNVNVNDRFAKMTSRLSNYPSTWLSMCQIVQVPGPFGRSCACQNRTMTALTMTQLSMNETWQCQSHWRKKMTSKQHWSPSQLLQHRIFPHHRNEHIMPVAGYYPAIIQDESAKRLIPDCTWCGNFTFLKFITHKFFVKWHKPINGLCDDSKSAKLHLSQSETMHTLRLKMGCCAIVS